MSELNLYEPLFEIIKFLGNNLKKMYDTSKKLKDVTCEVKSLWK